MVNLRANKIYGTSGPDANGSALFNGTDYLTADNATAFRVNQGSGQDFTIEAWIYVTAAPVGANANIASVYVTSGNQRSYMFYVSPDLELKFNYASSGTSGSVSTLNAGTIPTNEWVHVAITNDTSATTARLFKNGLLKDDDTGAHTTYYANTTGDFKVGNDFTGYISNLHINRGTCKYTASFDPYKQPIEVETNTTVLCCNSSTDALNDDKSNSFAQTASDGVKPTSDMPFSRSDAGVVFDGDPKFNTQGHMYFPTGDTSQRGRGRAVSWWGIYNSSGNYTKDVDYFDIQSLGTTTKFGEISDTIGLGAGMSSSTRGVFAGGTKPAVGNMNLLEYITLATTGNAVDFGGISTLFRYGAGISNQTRGLIAGAYQGSGASGTLNTIQYLTIATTGDTLDFGDMVADGGTGVQGMASCSSSTRGITFGGGTPTTINEMNYITIGTLGNSVDFGDLSAARYLGQGVSSSTRGVVGGGDNSGVVNIIEYITIATTGNATDFGDMMTAREHSGSEGGSNGIRGVFVGGGDWPAGNNTMEYITIATTGNTKDFGDSRTAISAPYGSTTVSDCHGGLS